MEERPKPHPPTPKPSPVEAPKEQEKVSKPSPKKPYVVRPHLTDKPLANNEGLAALRRSMQTPPSTKRPAQKPTKKSQEKK